MTDKKLSTDPYKGVRDFYPTEMAIQQYIFDIWNQTAQSFGFEKYDASILEPSELYKAKGAENEEMVNEQTYTFTDRGEREVTLRPEMTPTVARMVAAKAREMAFPIRWYSTPNLFRYERPQRGRLREHWQLNCDIFGSSHLAADVEIIALANQVLLNFGATSDQFEIRINDRDMMKRLYLAIGVSEEMIPAITKVNDRKAKISEDEYRTTLTEITSDETLAEEIIMLLNKSDEQTDVIVALNELGINNVVFDKSLARGFDYYTDTIFEIFDTSEENNRSLIGGGRYKNLTSMFDSEPIPGVGFGMGDVTMRDFLETHNLLPDINPAKVKVVIIPVTEEQNLYAESIAKEIRTKKVKVMTDFSNKKTGKKISRAEEIGAEYVIVVGEEETDSNDLTLKNIKDASEISGPIRELLNQI